VNGKYDKKLVIFDTEKYKFDEIKNIEIDGDIYNYSGMICK
jgi:hypothetical protein